MPNDRRSVPDNSDSLRYDIANMAIDVCEETIRQAVAAIDALQDADLRLVGLEGLSPVIADVRLQIHEALASLRGLAPDSEDLP